MFPAESPLKLQKKYVYENITTVSTIIIYFLSKTTNFTKTAFDYISNLADNRAAIKPSQDEWSILDILEHLYVIEKVMTKEIKQILEKNDRKKAFKHKPLDGMLDRSNKFKAPENMKPNNEFTTLKEAKDKLTTSRHTLLNVLKAYDQSDLTANSGKHPAFGTISVVQWIEFIGLHEKRHLSQLKELVNNL